MLIHELAKKLRIRHAPTFGILDACEADRMRPETVFETATRLLLFEALLRGQGDQKRAAAILGVSERTINYKLELLGWRPTDRKQAKRGTRGGTR